MAHPSLDHQQGRGRAGGRQRARDGARVVVVTPNPAIDITYEVASPRLGVTNRVTGVTRRPGGKGLNVASVLTQLGGLGLLPERPRTRLRVTGFLGGRHGGELRAGLSHWEVEQRWLDPGHGYETRATVLVRDRDGGATGFYEAGHPVAPGAWDALGAMALAGVGDGDVLVVSGSCPPGTRPEDLSALLAAARERGARTVLDTSGPLLLGCAGVADVVKPNLEELIEATGAAGLTGGAEVLLRAGARAVVVSDGPRGIDLVTRPADGGRCAWHAPAPRVEVVNPTGAGDAAVAALAAYLVAHPRALTVDERALEAAVALSVAAVRTPVAGLVEPGTYTSLLTTVKAGRRDAAD